MFVVLLSLVPRVSLPPRPLELERERENGVVFSSHLLGLRPKDHGVLSKERFILSLIVLLLDSGLITLAICFIDNTTASRRFLTLGVPRHVVLLK